MSGQDTVPFHVLTHAHEPIATELEAAAMRVIRSGRYLFGPELEAFEVELATWFGVQHAVGVASGTDALEIALRACHVGIGERVSITAMTAPAAVNAIEAAGATAELIDVESGSRNAERIGLSRVAIDTSLYGEPSWKWWIDQLTTVVEDVAHAMGAMRDGRKVGTRGVAGAVSFYPSKTLGALGDGGAIITDDAKVAAAAREIRHYGMVDDGDIAARGQNSRLSEIQAALLRVKLPRLDDWNRERRSIAARYTAELADRVMCPCLGATIYYLPVFHCYVVEHPERDRIREGLRHRGIDAHVHYPRAIHQYRRWAHLGAPGAYPRAEEMSRQVLSLPCFPGLTEREQVRVIAAVRELT